MKSRAKLLPGVLALLAAAVYGCTQTDAPLEPSPGAEVQAARISGQGARSLQVLARKQPVSGDLSSAAVIGPQGGELGLPSAGLRVTFPAGAVTEAVEIRVRAVPGTGVAYEFQPHGLQFQRAVRVEQSLRGTAVEGNPSQLRLVKGIYYTGSLEDGSARASEFQPTAVFGGSVAVFSIFHFSGYLLGVG